MTEYICRWYERGGYMDSKSHNFFMGECLQCGTKDTSYRPKINNCLYCGRSTLGRKVCLRCNEALDREQKLYDNHTVGGGY